jgi:hypothetical protein
MDAVEKGKISCPGLEYKPDPSVTQTVSVGTPLTELNNKIYLSNKDIHSPIRLHGVVLN